MEFKIYLGLVKKNIQHQPTNYIILDYIIIILTFPLLGIVTDGHDVHQTVGRITLVISNAVTR